MKRSIAVVMLCVLLPACNLELKKDAPPESDSGTAAPTAPAPMRTGLDIGDLEVTAVMHLVVTEKSVTDRVKLDTLLTATDVVTMQTADLSKPYPESLIIELQRKVTSDFSVQPGIIRGSIMRQINDEPNKEKIEDVIILLTKKTNLELVFALDALKGLKEYPETMSITLEGEGILLEEGADIESVDPATATAPPERMTRALSVNPLRINFVDGPAPLSSSGSANEELAEETASSETVASDAEEIPATDATEEPVTDAAPEVNSASDESASPAGE